MERDHKYSGTLPLLAYAPQDFGLHAQRSRAYRARAAMGRTGVQPLRSHAQAPAKPVAAEAAPENAAPSTSLFKTLWQRFGTLFGQTTKQAIKAENTVSHAAQPPVRNASQSRIASRQQVAERSLPQEPVTMQRLSTQLPEKQPEPAENTSLYHPVSKTYAAMRKGGADVITDEQAIPQAPDLAHALAEIRAALREHEKLASARQNGAETSGR